MKHPIVELADLLVSQGLVVYLSKSMTCLVYSTSLDAPAVHVRHRLWKFVLYAVCKTDKGSEDGYVTHALRRYDEILFLHATETEVPDWFKGARISLKEVLDSSSWY